MKKLILLLLVFVEVIAYSQNVGIGTASPIEKLDVNGNINLSGTIKAAGVAGNNGDVLMSTGTGLSWGSFANFKHSVMFTNPGTGSWIVPPNVTEIMIEVWGAGAGGTTLTGGSSGGYAKTTIFVTPGATANTNVGSGTVGAAYVSAPGGASSVNIGAITITATGAGGSDWSNNSLNIGYPGVPGSFSINPSNVNLFGLPGRQGNENKVVYQQYATGQFSTITYYGSGAPSVGLITTDANPGDMTEYHTTFYTGHYPKNTFTPGGGGGGGTGSGYRGGDGMVIIWFN